MLGSLPLSPQPTARETREIVFRLGHELAARGARVRHDVVGGFRFRMPAPWGGRGLGPLRAVWSGEVTIGAVSGDPWRVRYDLRFSVPAIVTLALCIVLVRYGFQGHWPRTRLLDLVLITWLATYGIPCLLAMRMFRELVAEATAGVKG
jgi:hypothetical protein